MSRRLGPLSQKILLLLIGGLSLGLTHSPGRYFKIVKDMGKAWHEINRKQLSDSIRSLYRSKLISMKENKDGSIKMTLTEKGKKRILLYNFEQMIIPKPNKWDKKWRIVTFDIPENLKKARNALRTKLKDLGFLKYQKSIFIYPYECKDEVDFVIEFFDIRSYVRYIVAENLDNELDFRKQFELL
jgi:DNA-binding transcriptional regulator PaaX